MLEYFLGSFVVALVSLAGGYVMGCLTGARDAEKDNRLLSSELSRTRDEKEVLRSKLYAVEGELAEAEARISMLRMGAADG